MTITATANNIPAKADTIMAAIHKKKTAPSMTWRFNASDFSKLRFEPPADIIQFFRAKPLDFALICVKFDDDHAARKVLTWQALAEHILALPTKTNKHHDKAVGNSDTDSDADSDDEIAQLSSKIKKVSLDPPRRMPAPPAPGTREFLEYAKAKELDIAHELGIHNRMTKRYFEALVPYEGGKFAVGGLIDGLRVVNSQLTLVEIKCRKYMLFWYTPEYELNQIHVYMWLTGVRHCVLIQHFKGKTRESMIHFDKRRWANIMASFTQWANELDAITKA
ncbi:hypothetical protein BC828DRAFT_388578 [Blastocladiella britannica]|nr:hypothetical protein BC828DRAFT_388578 [Blastocladiella britannica]